MPEPRWNGEPCEAEIVRVIVADNPPQTHERGWGWAKVMAGGGPNSPHASLKVEREVTTDA